METIILLLVTLALWLWCRRDQAKWR